MLYDRENNYIRLEIPKDKTDTGLGSLVSGLSGFGKTFYAVNSVMQYAQLGNRVAIVDYAGCYSEDELKKSMADMDKIEMIKPTVWNLNFTSNEELVSEFSEALARVIKTRSYRQDSLLKKLCVEIFERYKYISISKIVETLKENIDCEIYESDSEMQVAEKIIERLDRYREVDIRFVRNRKYLYKSKMIHVIQLDHYSLDERMAVAALFIELIWRETKKNKKIYDFLVLDEVHLLSKFYGGLAGSCIDTILRESRRYGMRPVLLSQLVYSFSSEDVDILNQVGFKIMFRATAKEAKKMAKEFEDNYEEWEIILKNLNKGECVIKGMYRVNNKALCNVPIVCNVVSRNLSRK